MSSDVGALMLASCLNLFIESRLDFHKVFHKFPSKLVQTFVELWRQVLWLWFTQQLTVKIENLAAQVSLMPEPYECSGVKKKQVDDISWLLACIWQEEISRRKERSGEVCQWKEQPPERGWWHSCFRSLRDLQDIEDIQAYYGNLRSRRPMSSDVMVVAGPTAGAKELPHNIGVHCQRGKKDDSPNQDCHVESERSL